VRATLSDAALAVTGAAAMTAAANRSVSLLGLTFASLQTDYTPKIDNRRILGRFQQGRK
jgi:hypothetical protein